MGGTLNVRPEWDAVLTYDALAIDGPRPVFVGRRDLLDVIVGTIRQPERRGTILVSGYRGAGKTTLLIEAICRARTSPSAGYRLLPLVLNASEVSASLGAPSPTLQIAPQQLLAALIRALRNIAQAQPDKANAVDDALSLSQGLVQ